MERRRTALIFAAGAAAGLILAGLLAAMLLVECDSEAGGGPRDAGAGSDPGTASTDRDEDDDPAKWPAASGGLSDRGVGGPCSYSGTVVDGDGRPLVGALVGVRALDVPWSEADLSAEARTGGTGGFVLSGLSEGIPFQVFAFAPGMAVADVERPACGATLDFALEPGARLTIEARSEGQRPPGALEVQIAGDPLWPPRVALTDGRGRLDVEGLPPGDYAIWVGGHGLAALTGEPVSLGAGEQRTVELELEPTGGLEVSVVDDESAAPIPGATVFARPRAAPLLVLTGLTDERGSARFADLAPARHDVETIKAGYLRGDPVPATVGGTTALRLRRGARVAGRVLLRDGSPAAGSRLEVEEELGLARVAWAGGDQREILGRIVRAQQTGFPPVRPLRRGTLAGPALIPLPEMTAGAGATQPGIDSWQADQDGRFVLDGLPPGGVVIGASHPDMVLDTPARLTLDPGGDLDGVRVVMRPGAALRVRTLGENGYPLHGAEVAVFGSEDQPLTRAITGSDGFAELRGLPSRVRVEAALDGHVPAVARVETRPGRTAEIALTMPRADRVLGGRLTDPRGFGVGGALITARSITRGLAHALQTATAPDGSFALEGVGPGDYHVAAEVGGRPVAQFPAARAGEDVKLVTGDGGSGPGPEPGPAPDFVTPELFAAAAGQPATPIGDGDDDGQNLGVIALTETLESESRASEYGYVDQLPVTGPVPGKGGLPVEIGGGPGNVVVKSVAPGSHVFGAGLRAGDRIVAVDGRKVQTPAQAKAAIGGPIGSVVVLEVLKGGESVSLVIQRVRVR